MVAEVEGLHEAEMRVEQYFNERLQMCFAVVTVAIARVLHMTVWISLRRNRMDCDDLLARQRIPFLRFPRSGPLAPRRSLLYHQVPMCMTTTASKRISSAGMIVPIMTHDGLGGSYAALLFPNASGIVAPRQEFRQWEFAGNRCALDPYNEKGGRSSSMLSMIRVSRRIFLSLIVSLPVIKTISFPSRSNQTGAT